MATLARPGRSLNPRVQRAYRLEMAGRTVALLAGLLALTGLVIFYLGVVTGKGLRDPNASDTAATTAPAPTTDAATGTTPTALNHALTAQNGQIEGLKKDETDANAQTQQLLSRAKQQLDMEEVKPGASATTPPAASTPAAKTAAQPAAPAAKPASARPKPAAAPAQKKPMPAVAKTAAPADAEGGYTVQVFSSPQQQSAQDILSDLKKKGFPAYLNPFQAADKRTWYRVRVGKGSRQDAESLAAKIRQQSTLQDLRVLKL
jgi:cell division septation protein DedD